VGILRHYIVVLLQSPPKQLPRAALREQCVLEIEISKFVRVLTNVQTCFSALADSPRDGCVLPYTAPILYVNIAASFRRIRRWDVPQRRAPEGRFAQHSSESYDGPSCHGRHDVGHENSNGHDGTPDDHYGMDKLFLPRLCAQ